MNIFHEFPHHTHIYKWINIKDIKNENIKPDYLKEKLLNIKDNFEFIE